MNKKSSVSYLYIAAVLVVVGLVIFAVTKEKAPSVYDDFAQCIKDNGAVMYGAWWCPHCNNQKELFGNSVSYIDYVECSEPGSRKMNQVCKDAKVEGYPTWKFEDGSSVSGEQSLEYLGEKTGCELPTIK